MDAASSGNAAAVPGPVPSATAPREAAPGDTAPPEIDPVQAALAALASASAPQPAARANRRAPGLDGVRALAVLAVLAFHESLPWIQGGFIGVDVFFVLSGYLITDLLVTRFGREGRIGLGGFYQRRARRLLPALGLMVVTVAAAVSVLEPDQRASLRPALLGAVTYTSNWFQALTHQSYFQRYGPPPPLEHLWSLAVEEQFYLIWPLIIGLVLLTVRVRAVRPVLVLAGAAGSALAMYAIYRPGSDPSVVYYGTDTHAFGLMIGAALALTWPLAKVATAARKYWLVLDLAGLAGLMILAWAAWHFSGADPAVYPYGLVLASVAAGALVLAAAAPGKVGTLLSAGPLRWLGVRSYGIYLWHWPVIAITAGLFVRSATSAGARVVDLVLPIGIAAASWRWLEEPILRNGFRTELRRRGQMLARAITTGWREPAALAALLPAIALVVLTGTAGYGVSHPPTGPTLQQQIARAERIVALSNASPVAAPPQRQPSPWWLRPGHERYRGRSRPLHHHKRRHRVTGGRVIAIGDSVMLAAAPELERELPGIYVNAQVSRAMVAGVGIVQQLARAKRLRPILVVGLGTNGPITLFQIQQLRAAIGDRWLILVNTFVPRPWEQEVNSTMIAAIHRFPNVLLVNWHRAIEHHQGLLWSDGIHPMPTGGLLYARTVRTAVLKALRTRPRLRWPKPKAARHNWFTSRTRGARRA